MNTKSSQVANYILHTYLEDNKLVAALFEGIFCIADFYGTKSTGYM